MNQNLYFIQKQITQQPHAKQTSQFLLDMLWRSN
jgi:hypothetical protein